jgi:hypothetical protein
MRSAFGLMRHAATLMRTSVGLMSSVRGWDYGEMGELDPEEISKMVTGAKLFVQAIEELLQESGFGKEETENGSGQKTPGSSP